MRSASGPTPDKDPDKDADPRRALPSVERLLATARLRELADRFTRAEVKREVVALLEEARRASEPGLLTEDSVASSVEIRLASGHELLLRPVINGTGILIHTNLGRSPIHAEAWDDASELVER